MADRDESLTDKLMRYADKATKSVSQAWDKTMGMPEEIAQQTYDYVISQGGTEDQAQRAADRLAAKAGRTVGLIDLMTPQSPADVALMAAGPLGPATKAGKAALGAGSAMMVMDPSEAEASPLTKIGRGLSKFIEGSVLRNPDGTPTRLYHGSKSDIEYFNPYHPDRKDTGWMGRGVYAFDSPAGANVYAMMKRGPVGENVTPLYGRLTNPYEFTMAEKKAMSSWDQGKIDDFTSSLLAKGHDGAILKYPDGGREVVIYDPKMVKSAIGNTGDYDTTTDLLTKSHGGAVHNYARGGDVTDKDIQGLYETYFGRAPESQAAVDYWRNTANQNNLSLSDIGQQFATSEEGQQKYAMLDKLLGNRAQPEDQNVTVVEQTNAPDRWQTYWGYKPTQQDYTMMLRAGLGEYGTPQSYDQYRAIYEAIGNRAAANTIAPYYVRGSQTLAGQITPSQVEGAFATSRINSLINSDDPQKIESLYLAQKALEDYFMEGKNRVLTTQTDWRGFQQGQPSPGTGFTNALVPGGEDLSIYNRFYDARNNPDLTQKLSQLQNQRNALWAPPVPLSRPTEQEFADYAKSQQPDVDPMTVYQTFALGDPMTGNPFDTNWFSGPTATTSFEQQAADERAQALNNSLMQQTPTTVPDTYNPNYTLFSDANQFYGSQSSLPTLAVSNVGLNNDYGMFSSPGSLGEGASGLTSFSPSLSDYSSSWGSMGYSPMSWDSYSKGGKVNFKPMFEGDSQELQDKARELAREAYSRGPASMGKERAQEWEALARKYNLPLTVGPYDSYEDQYSDALSNWQRNVSPKQRQQTYAEGGAVRAAREMDSLTQILRGQSEVARFDKGGPVMSSIDPMGSFTGMDSVVAPEKAPLPREALEARLDPSVMDMLGVQGMLIPNRAVDIKQDDLGYYPVDAEGNKLPWVRRPGVLPFTRDDGELRMAMPYLLEMAGNTLGGVASPVTGGMALGAGPIRRGEKTLAELVDTYGVKKPGGNWDELSIEKSLGPLYKIPDTLDEADNASAAAVNKWVDTKLKGYVKNQMGTVADPLIDVAEVSGRLHIPEEQIRVRPGSMWRPFALNPDDKWTPTTGSGSTFNPNLIGESDLSRAWEKATQGSISRSLRKDWGENELEINDLQSLIPLPPETQINTPFRNIASNPALGFDHLVDELRNATMPNSDLPDRLKIDPAKLERFSMSQAVEHVAKINEWRAENMAKANAELSKNAATVPFKQYEVVPGTNAPNERGLYWAELKPSAEDKEALEKALKYEGDTMGHCVGGYCPDVEAGRSQIFSLRDKKGEPHVTIEVQRRRPGFSYEESSELETLANIAANRANLSTSQEWDDFKWKKLEELKKEAYAKKAENAPLDIYQIKGKQNLAPKEDYIPFVQDFVKSQNWGQIGNLRNARMAKVEPGHLMPGVPEKIKPGYYTFDELKRIADDNGVPESEFKTFLDRLLRFD